MLVAYSYVATPDAVTAAEFAAAMAQRSRLVESFPGFVRFEFRRELGRDRRFVIATWWESRDDLQRYLRSPEHAVTHERLAAETRVMIGRPRVEVQEVLETSS